MRKRLNKLSGWVGLTCFCVVALGASTVAARAGQHVTHEPVSKDGTLSIPAFQMPFSVYASPEAHKVFIERVKKANEGLKYNGKNIRKFRQQVNGKFAKTVEVERQMYPVRIKSSSIAGISVVIVTPKDGVSPDHKRLILMNLHGGGFLYGSAATTGMLDSIALSSVGKYKIISVNYRMGPEYRFPAASEDITKVYKELLKTHSPKEIGIYGCSAGGMLTAQSVAWFISKNLPVPGAIGTFCGSVAKMGGDSASLSGVLNGNGPSQGIGSGDHVMPYFKGVSPNNPLAYPGLSPKILAKFPPTLLITGTRDFTMSSVVQSDVELTKAGVDAKLLVFDGMWHGFMGANPKLPETKTVWNLTAKFFDKHLGR